MVVSSQIERLFKLLQETLHARLPDRIIFSAETLDNPPLIARIQGRTSRHPFESVRLALTAQ